MKRILLTLSIVVCICSLSFADGIISTKNHTKNTSNISSGGIYIGAGGGWFGAAKKFQAHEPEDGTQFSYVEKKPKGDPAVTPNILVGYRFNEYFSADLNAQYRRFKYEGTRIDDEDPGNIETSVFTQKIKNYSLFFNANFGYPITYAFTPYITAGVGYACNDAGYLEKVSTSSELAEVVPGVGFKAPGTQTNNLAWNAGVGARLVINQSIELDLNYKYVDLGKIKVKNTTFNDFPDDIVTGTSQSLRIHQIMLNLIYNL